MSRLLGFILIIAGIYFLGQNIIFATTFFPYGYRSLLALGSVLSIIAGVITLVFFPRGTGNYSGFRINHLNTVGNAHPTFCWLQAHKRA